MLLVHTSCVRSEGMSTSWAQEICLKNQWNLHILFLFIVENS